MNVYEITDVFDAKRIVVAASFLAATRDQDGDIEIKSAVCLFEGVAIVVGAEDKLMRLEALNASQS